MNAPVDMYNQALSLQDVALLKGILQGIFEDEEITDEIVETARFNCPTIVKRKALLYGWNDAEVQDLFQKWAFFRAWSEITVRRDSGE